MAYVRVHGESKKARRSVPQFKVAGTLRASEFTMVALLRESNILYCRFVEQEATMLTDARRSLPAVMIG